MTALQQLALRMAAKTYLRTGTLAARAQLAALAAERRKEQTHD